MHGRGDFIIIYCLTVLRCFAIRFNVLKQFSIFFIISQMDVSEAVRERNRIAHISYGMARYESVKFYGLNVPVSSSCSHMQLQVLFSIRRKKLINTYIQSIFPSLVPTFPCLSTYSLLDQIPRAQGFIKPIPPASSLFLLPWFQYLPGHLCWSVLFVQTSYQYSLHYTYTSDFIISRITPILLLSNLDFLQLLLKKSISLTKGLFQLLLLISDTSVPYITVVQIPFCKTLCTFLSQYFCPMLYSSEFESLLFSYLGVRLFHWFCFHTY